MDNMNQEPFSCLYQILTYPNSVCGEKINKEALEAASKTFQDVTNFSYNDLITLLKRENKENYMVQLNNLFFFIPMFLLVIIFSLVLFFMGSINWVVMVYLVTISFIGLYFLSYAYRTILFDLFSKENKKISNSLEKWNETYQNSIAYLPQALAAVSCAVVNKDNPWKCNNPCQTGTTIETRNNSNKKNEKVKNIKE